ncbi:pyruvate kinase [Buchnera aphidicola (Ceratovacuna keduensis)]|uniref:pyruvate kinase n=1 Tax=Buchnera aphidicola TaxID=9 RepID=UPI0031B868D5
MNKLKKTKIIATMGPSTNNIKILEKMIINGVNVFRLNFSHGNKTDHLKKIKMIFYLRNKLNYNIGILGDLQGPKIRISKFKNNKIFLKKNNIFILDYRLKNKYGNEHHVGINYKNLYKDLSNGDILLLDDGKIYLKVKYIKIKKIVTKVIIGGILLNNKGINKLGGGLSAKSITNKDKKDIIFSSKINLDYLAVSFPKSYKDINIVRNLINSYGRDIKIVAKIERAEVVNNSYIMNKIIKASDAVMVARGDLGVEISESKIALAQKKIVINSIKLNKIIIIATQMMESMINNPFPTRAEVMDVSNSILDGTDAVMLSAETASGKYPAETVLCMSKICIEVEKFFNNKKFKIYSNKKKSINQIISSSAVYISNSIKSVSAIVNIYKSKKKSLIFSRIFSKNLIFYFSHNKNILNYFTLCKGIMPIYLKKIINKKNIEKKVIVFLLKNKFIKKNDLIVFFKKNNNINILNNFIKILKV